MFRKKSEITLPDSRTKKFMHLLLPLVLLFESCRTAPPDSRSAVDLDLTEHFELMPGNRDKPMGGKFFTRHSAVARKGQRRDAMVLVAPVVIRASFEGVSGRICLKGFAAPVFNIGDGVQMDVWLVDAEPGQKVFSRYFDAGRVEKDRDWIPFEIPVDLDGAERHQVEIRASGGPDGDHVADWLAVSSPVVSRLCAIK